MERRHTEHECEAYMKLVSESEYDVILDRRKVDRPESISERRPATASGARMRLRVRTTASPISRMGTSIEDDCRAV